MDKKTHYVIFLAIVFAIGASGSWAVSQSVGDWYPSLPLSRYSPPPDWFGVIWPIMYGLIAATGARLWRKRKIPAGRRAVICWSVQLVLNGAWPWIFFYFRRIELAAVELTGLILAVGFLLFYARKADRLSFVLLIPYACWLLFAGFLNWSVYFSQ